MFVCYIFYVEPPPVYPCTRYFLSLHCQCVVRTNIQRSGQYSLTVSSCGNQASISSVRCNKTLKLYMCLYWMSPVLEVVLAIVYCMLILHWKVFTLCQCCTLLFFRLFRDLIELWGESNTSTLSYQVCNCIYSNAFWWVLFVLMLLMSSYFSV